MELPASESTEFASAVAEQDPVQLFEVPATEGHSGEVTVQADAPAEASTGPLPMPHNLAYTVSGTTDLIFPEGVLSTGDRQVEVDRLDLYAALHDTTREMVLGTVTPVAGIRALSQIEEYARRRGVPHAEFHAWREQTMHLALAAAQEASAGETVVRPAETSMVPAAEETSIWSALPEKGKGIEAQRLAALSLSPKVRLATEAEAAALAGKASTPLSSPEWERGRARDREPAEAEGVVPPQAVSA
jgi:hypothetical protein